jgi:hypothetical protein
VIGHRLSNREKKLNIARVLVKAEAEIWPVLVSKTNAYVS